MHDSINMPKSTTTFNAMRPWGEAHTGIIHHAHLGVHAQMWHPADTVSRDFSGQWTIYPRERRWRAGSQK